MIAVALLLALVAYLLGSIHGFEDGRCYEREAQQMTAPWQLGEWYESRGYVPQNEGDTFVNWSWQRMNEKTRPVWTRKR